MGLAEGKTATTFGRYPQSGAAIIYIAVAESRLLMLHDLTQSKAQDTRSCFHDPVHRWPFRIFDRQVGSVRRKSRKHAEPIDFRRPAITNGPRLSHIAALPARM